MKETSEKSSQPTLKDSSRSTSSPASVDGPSRSSGPGGKGQSGPAPARVSRFRAPESEAANPTSSIYGPPFGVSSPSVDLQRLMGFPNDWTKYAPTETL